MAHGSLECGAPKGYPIAECGIESDRSAELAQGFGPCVEHLADHIQIQLPVHMDERVPEASQERQAVSQLLGESPMRGEEFEGLSVAARNGGRWQVLQLVLLFISKGQQSESQNCRATERQSLSRQ